MAGENSNGPRSTEAELKDRSSASRKNTVSRLVPAAVEIFMIAIDQCHQLIENLPSTQRGTKNLTAKRYRKAISVRQQREKDDVIDAFFNDVRRREEEEAKRLGLTEKQAEDGEPVYPFKTEVIVVSSQIMYSKIYEDAVSNYFTKYFDDPVVAEYILANILYRFRTRRRCCDLQIGWMSRLRQDRGLCSFACST